MHRNIPIYYHCQPDIVIKSNGAIEGASSAFETDDKVILQFSWDQDQRYTPWAVVGFKDEKKPCGDKLFMIVIDDRLMTDPYDSDSSHLILTVYSVATEVQGGFSILTTPAVNVTSDMNGGLLIVQSSETNNMHLATLPNKFTISDSLSDEPGFGESGWNSIYLKFNHNVIKGSYRAYNPVEGMGYNHKARRGYKIESTDSTSFYFNIKSEILSPSNCYCYVGTSQTNRTMLKQWITYKTDPYTDVVMTSNFIGEDHETQNNVLKDGYMYWYFHVIAILDKRKAIYRKVTQNMILSRFGVRWLPLTGQIDYVCYAYDGNTGAPCKIASRRQGTFFHAGEVGQVEFTEELYFDNPNVPFLSLIRKEFKVKCEGWLYAWYQFPLTSQSNSCTGGAVPPVVCGADYNGSVTGGGPLPVKYRITDQGVVVLANDHTRVFGQSNIQVYTYDNYQGDEVFFMIYSYDEYNIESEWEVNHYKYVYIFQRKYFLAYKTPTKSDGIAIAQWSIPAFGAPVDGTVVIYPSCQINRGMIFFTYVEATVNDNIPKTRTVGIINYSNKSFPLGFTTYTDASVFGIDPSVWLEKIAVGIST
ncbi:hypothetical protein MBAV_001105 [Candidatus Magnetobacterium bavaricum]|uniref:Uncharacterized protein n=1 Tax=Candidatus Magnetobacterium bavaricum TaxID=29290 RepID=A0A0F3GXU1_9BACT|nr:hypothetical protein MBAV_001105 [Candidatus Magnetobacterium bavaricum]